MLRARGQAEQYAKALPEMAAVPVVVDVGHSIETYADFSGAGKHYAHSRTPTATASCSPTWRDEEVRERLRRSGPTRTRSTRAARRAVTREVAARLAELAQPRRGGHAPSAWPTFLMRCLFTMFAEDVRLLPKDSFTRLLRGLRRPPAAFRAD